MLKDVTWPRLVPGIHIRTYAAQSPWRGKTRILGFNNEAILKVTAVWDMKPWNLKVYRRLPNGCAAASVPRMFSFSWRRRPLIPSKQEMSLMNLTFRGLPIVSIFQYVSNKMQRYTVYLYLETALRVSGGISTHHQEHTQLYLQRLVLVRPLLLPAAKAAGSSNGLTSTRYCRYSCVCSWWWVEIPPETCRAVPRYK